MVQEIENFIERLGNLVSKIKQNKSTFISRKVLKDEINSVSSVWLRRISTGLRTESSLEEEEVNKVDATIESILELTVGNNRKSSYLNFLNPLSKNLQKNILIPLIRTNRSSAPMWEGTANKILKIIVSGEEKSYYEESFRAARTNCYKAAIVMTGCAIIDRIRRLIISKGLPAFNQVSKKLKNTKTGFYSRYNSEYNIKLENELQDVFDTNLVTVLSGMVSLDLNQLKAILNLLGTRNSCAHPSAYVVEEITYAFFLNEVYNLILNNPKFS